MYKSILNRPKGDFLEISTRPGILMFLIKKMLVINGGTT
jgi:hypothetical protein